MSKEGNNKEGENNGRLLIGFYYSEINFSQEALRAQMPLKF